MGRLSGELAHELNQPLNAIQNYVASLAKIIDSPTSPPAAAHVLKQLNNEISRAAKIIRRTREFVSTGKHQSDELRLSEMVEDTVAMLRGEARRRGMSLQVKDTHDKSTFMGDLVRLQQVLVNLVLNAMESMVNQPSSDKIVLIELSKPSNHHVLSVHDSGCGISEQEQSRLFDAFFTTKPTGLGMGLAISRGIIEDHGGTLTFQPRTSGGSTFTINLPC
jgi:C4-dicarboxylate-specific signal transduction histidine kinase